ncbi:MAG TPA: glycosyltransferase [Planctomycetaceae bacterium]|nr:glycosyltransferase [Planctomycetaceae bacterium]
MPHIGLICPELSGHLNPTLALGRELRRRGHRVTLVGRLDGEDGARAAGVGFRAVGEGEFPRGSIHEMSARLGTKSGLAAIRVTIAEFHRATEMLLRDVPPALESLGVDGLVVDQTSPAGMTVAEALGLPAVTLCSALPMNEEPGVPPLVTRWPYSPAWWARLRNRAGYFAFHRATGPIIRGLNRQRAAWGLRPVRRRPEMHSQLALVAQLPAELDFPRRDLPPWFHYTGPLSDPSSRAAVEFPFDRLDGRPLVYASMGTLQNRQEHVFHAIAGACAGLDVQLVISRGRRGAEPTAALPGSPLVVPYAPQLELLRRAALVITHAGMNTVLESLAQGVPLVAVPITNDQPGVAARVAWSGAGEVVPLRKLSAARLRTAVVRVLSRPSYRQHAERLQAAIERSGGLVRAGEIAELAIATGQPVLSGHVGRRPEDYPDDGAVPGGQAPEPRRAAPVPHG